MMNYISAYKRYADSPEAGIGMGLLFVAIGISGIRNCRRANRLKEICTVPVDARCIRAGGGKWQPHSCVYQFEYRGRTYNACNGIGRPSRYSKEYFIPDEGGMIQIMIDPYNPERNIYDPYARGTVSDDYGLSALFLLFGLGYFIFKGVLPVLRNMGII